MTSQREQILVVESDAGISDLITRQTLQPLGYSVKVVETASQALKEVLSSKPDVILADLDLPDLSAKDLLVALSSQAIDVPVVILAEKGLEGDLIQAFRLGAEDYLPKPIREAEVVAVVERLLKQGRARREREDLARQLDRTNQELQRRVRELTTILAIGKAVTLISNTQELLEKVIEGAVYVCEADLGWLLVREDQDNAYILRASRNLPESLRLREGQVWDDGISSLVAISGEPLSIHGEPLSRFKISSLGKSVLVVPVKVKKDVLGLLVVMGKNPVPFGEGSQALLEAVADYAAISMVNAGLFKVLQARAQQHQADAERAKLSEKIYEDLLANLCIELPGQLRQAEFLLNELVVKQNGELGLEQRSTIQAVQRQLELAGDSLGLLPEGKSEQEDKITPGRTDINALVRQSLARFQQIAHRAGITLIADLSTANLIPCAAPSEVALVLDGLVSNAIKYNNTGGQVAVRVEKNSRNGDNSIHVCVHDSGIGIAPEVMAHLLSGDHPLRQPAHLRYGGIGISIAMIKAILTAYGGKLWAESEPGQGSSFHFAIPLSR